jgi:hypothetical protein
MDMDNAPITTARWEDRDGKIVKTRADVPIIGRGRGGGMYADRDEVAIKKPRVVSADEDSHRGPVRQQRSERRVWGKEKKSSSVLDRLGPVGGKEGKREKRASILDRLGPAPGGARSSRRDYE